MSRRRGDRRARARAMDASNRRSPREHRPLDARHPRRGRRLWRFRHDLLLLLVFVVVVIRQIHGRFLRPVRRRRRRRANGRSPRRPRRGFRTRVRFRVRARRFGFRRPGRRLRFRSLDFPPRSRDGNLELVRIRRRRVDVPRRRDGSFECERRGDTRRRRRRRVGHRRRRARPFARSQTRRPRVERLVVGIRLDRRQSSLRTPFGGRVGARRRWRPGEGR